MDVRDAGPVVVELCAIAFAGRVLLALLPPGAVGSHALRSLPLTWAASHLCGRAALDAERAFAHRMGWAPSIALLVAPWALVLAARLATLPGAMVPRHEPRSERWSMGASLLVAAACALVLATAIASARVGVGGARAVCLATADELALLAALDHALATARRAPIWRAVVVACIAGSFALHGSVGSGAPTVRAASAFGAGASFGVAWLRRGDRRGKALAVLAFASAAVLGTWSAIVAAGALLVLVARTPAPARNRTAIASVAACALFLCAAWADPRREWTGTDAFASRSWIAPASSGVTDAGLVLALTLVVVVELRRARWRATAGEASSSLAPFLVDPPATEARALRDLLCLTVVLLFLGEVMRDGIGAPTSLLPLAPVAFLACGLCLGRAERADRAS